TLSDGTHTLTTRTIDGADNTTAGVFRGYTLNTTAPGAVDAVTALSADTGTSGSDFITMTASQTVSGTLGGTLNAGETVEVSADGSTWVTATIIDSSWSASGVTLSDDTH